MQVKRFYGVQSYGTGTTACLFFRRAWHFVPIKANIAGVETAVFSIPDYPFRSHAALHLACRYGVEI
jgi:hypothetical protein